MSFRRVNPPEGFVRLGDFVLTDADIDNPDLTVPVIMDYGATVKPAEDFELVWKNRAAWGYDEQEGCEASLWRAKDVVDGAHRYKAVGFVLVVGHNPPPAGVCHLVLADLLDNTDAITAQINTADIPLFVELNKLRTAESLGSVLWTKTAVTSPIATTQWDSWFDVLLTAEHPDNALDALLHGVELEMPVDSDARTQLRFRITDTAQSARKRFEAEPPEDKSTWGAEHKSALQQLLKKLMIEQPRQKDIDVTLHVWCPELPQPVPITASVVWKPSQLVRQCVKQLRSTYQVRLPRNGKRHMLVHSGQKLSDDGDKTLLDFDLESETILHLVPEDNSAEASAAAAAATQTQDDEDTFLGLWQQPLGRAATLGLLQVPIGGNRMPRKLLDDVQALEHFNQSTVDAYRQRKITYLNARKFEEKGWGPWFHRDYRVSWSGSGNRRWKGFFAAFPLLSLLWSSGLLLTMLLRHRLVHPTKPFF